MAVYSTIIHWIVFEACRSSFTKKSKIIFNKTDAAPRLKRSIILSPHSGRDGLANDREGIAADTIKQARKAIKKIRLSRAPKRIKLSIGAKKAHINIAFEC